MTTCSAKVDDLLIWGHAQRRWVWGLLSCTLFNRSWVSKLNPIIAPAPHGPDIHPQQTSSRKCFLIDIAGRGAGGCSHRRRVWQQPWQFGTSLSVKWYVGALLFCGYRLRMELCTRVRSWILRQVFGVCFDNLTIFQTRRPYKMYVPVLLLCIFVPALVCC